MKTIIKVMYSALVVLVIISLFPGCSPKKTANSNCITFNMGRPPRTCDPQVTTEDPAFIMLSCCMEGLVRLGLKTGEVVPGVAKSWDITDNGKTITFHLRKDSLWSNGETVKAQEFYNAIVRALDPITAYVMSNMLYPIINAEEFNSGKIKDPSKLGIKVIDDFTIEFKLKAPTPYFIQILALPCAFPLNEKFYKKVNKQYAQGKDKLLYNGPWVITKWLGNSEYTLEKNEKYWNKDNIKTDKLKFILVEDSNTASNMFRNKSLDITLIAGEQLPLFKNDKALTREPRGIWYIVCNNREKMFSNEKIRQAIGMAINRKALCENIRKDGSIPAYSFVPYGISGGEGISFREKFGDVLFKENIKEAKKLLKEGLAEIGHKGPVKMSLTIENTSSVKNDGVFIQEQLRTNLGIDLQLNIKTYNMRLEDYRQKNYEMMYTRWLPDYNDPMTYMDLWLSGQNNRPGWHNKKYDDYIKIASETIDNNVRMKALFDAEKLLLKEMPIIPIYFTCANWLIRSDIKDLALRPAGTEIGFYWAEKKNL